MPRPRPLLIRRPSISMTGAMPAYVPVMKASSAEYASVRLKFFSKAGMPFSRHKRSTLARVMPAMQ